MDKDSEIKIATLMADISYIKRDVIEIKTKMDSKYITKEEFEPIKKVVYGLVSIVLSAAIVALIALVIKK